MSTKLLHIPTNTIEEVSDKLVQNRILGPDYQFPENSMVWLRSKDGVVSQVTGQEAKSLINKDARFLPESKAADLVNQQVYDSSALGGILGFADYMTGGGVPYITRLLSDDAADKYANYAKYNPVAYHGTGIATSIGAALLTGGVGGAAGGARATAAIGSLSAKEAAKRVALGQAGAAAWRSQGALGKAGTIAKQLNAPALATRAGLATHKAVAGLVGKATSKAIPGQAGRSLDDIAPFAANLLKGTPAGAAAWMVEGGAFSAGQGLSEASLGNLDEASEHIWNKVESEAMFNGLVGAGFTAGLPLLGRAATGAAGGLGRVYELAANSGVSEALTNSMAKVAVQMRKGGKASVAEIEEAQLMLALGKDGQEARKQSKQMQSSLLDITEDVGETLEESFLIEELLQGTDQGGVKLDFILQKIVENDALSPGTIRGTLKALKEFTENAVYEAQRLGSDSPQNLRAVEEFIESWQIQSKPIGMIVSDAAGKAPSGWVEILDKLNLEQIAGGIKQRLGERGPGLGEILGSLRQHQRAGDVNAFISMLDNSANNMSQAEFSANVWKSVEGINNNFHGKFGDKLTSVGLVDVARDTVTKSSRKLQSDVDLFGSMGAWKKEYDRLRKDYGMTHKEFEADFFDRSGLDTNVNQEKVLGWMKSLNRTNISPKTQRLTDHRRKGLAALELVLNSHDLEKSLKGYIRAPRLRDFARKYVTETEGAARGYDSISQYYKTIQSGMRRAGRKTDDAVEYLTGDVSSALRWSTVQGATHNANEYFWRRMASFAPYLYSLPVGVGVNIAESIVDPVTGAGRLYFMENMVKMGKQESENLVNDYMKYLATGKRGEGAPRSVGRAFVLPAKSYRDPERAKEEEGRRGALKEAQDILSAPQGSLGPKQYKETKQFLTYLATDPIEMENFLNAATLPFGGETSEIVPVLKELMRKRVMHAYASLPRTSISNIFDQDPLPTSIQLAEFARVLEGLEDPASAMRSAISNGTVTKELIEAVKVGSPHLYSNFRTELMSALSDPDFAAKISRQDKLTLSQVFDIPMVNQQTMARLMQTFAPKQEGPGRPSTVKPMKSVTNTGSVMSSVVEKVG